LEPPSALLRSTPSRAEPEAAEARRLSHWWGAVQPTCPLASHDGGIGCNLLSIWKRRCTWERGATLPRHVAPVSHYDVYRCEVGRSSSTAESATWGNTERSQLVAYAKLLPEAGPFCWASISSVATFGSPPLAADTAIAMDDVGGTQVQLKTLCVLRGWSLVLDSI